MHKHRLIVSIHRISQFQLYIHLPRIMRKWEPVCVCFAASVTDDFARRRLNLYNPLTRPNVAIICPDECNWPTKHVPWTIPHFPPFKSASGYQFGLHCLNYLKSVWGVCKRLGEAVWVSWRVENSSCYNSVG